MYKGIQALISHFFTPWKKSFLNTKKAMLVIMGPAWTNAMNGKYNEGTWPRFSKKARYSKPYLI